MNLKQLLETKQLTRARIIVAFVRACTRALQINSNRVLIRIDETEGTARLSIEPDTAPEFIPVVVNADPLHYSFYPVEIPTHL